MLYKYFNKAWMQNKLAQSWLISASVPSKTLNSLREFIRKEMLKTTKELEYHPDFYQVIKEEIAKDITIEQIRYLQQFLYKKASIGPVKVIIIYEADLMNLNAANCCLKILEDSLASNYIFLISNRASSLIPTILSRCAKYEDKQILIANNQEFEYDQFLNLLINNDLDIKLEIIQKLKNKDRQLWKVISEYTLLLLSKVIKKISYSNISLNNKEAIFAAKLKDYRLQYLINKADYLEQIIADTIKYDLDMTASFILLIQELV